MSKSSLYQISPLYHFLTYSNGTVTDWGRLPDRYPDQLADQVLSAEQWSDLAKMMQTAIPLLSYSQQNLTLATNEPHSVWAWRAIPA